MKNRWTEKDDLDADFYGIVGPQINKLVSNRISGLLKISAAGGPRPDVQMPSLVAKLWR